MIHRVIRAAYFFEAKIFERDLSDIKTVQMGRLGQILKVVAETPFGRTQKWPTALTYDEFVSKFKVTDYTDWQSLIETDRGLQEKQYTSAVRYEPTSGSSGPRKWIPYTQEFLCEINRGAQVWIFDLYRQNAGIARGRHFWSLSWLPNELRKAVDTNDVSLFPWWQRKLINKFVITSDALKYAPTSESAWWAAKVILASADDLTLLSAWSPTYVLSLVSEIYEDRKTIDHALKNKSWGRFQEELLGYTAPYRSAGLDTETNLKEFIKSTWPKLSLISLWDSASSAKIALEVRKLFDGVQVQGKGLWATEGVVTIPWRGLYPLSIRSHFYEFKDLDTGRIFPAWELTLNQVVQPILTTSSGLIRYALPDRLRVHEFVGQTPCFEFMGRLNGVDLVGEKISFEQAEALLNDLGVQFPNHKIHSLTAEFISSRASYSVLAVGPREAKESLASALEEKLLQYHHYAVASELKQIGTAQSVVFTDDIEFNKFVSHYQQGLTNTAQIKGQSKLNSILLCSSLVRCPQDRV